MGRPIRTDDIFYLLEMVFIPLNRIMSHKNAAVKWFHMRCAYSMGRPI